MKSSNSWTHNPLVGGSSPPGPTNQIGTYLIPFSGIKNYPIQYAIVFKITVNIYIEGKLYNAEVY